MKIDNNEKSYTHNFYEGVDFTPNKSNENLKRDSKISFEDELQIPSPKDEMEPEDKGIYDEKTITEVSCPDKAVISENIIKDVKDVCIDEGVKVSSNIIEEDGSGSLDEAQEGKETALRTVRDESQVLDRKEVVIGEISDEKFTSLKDLFFSEDQKSAELDIKNSDEKKSADQGILKHSHETTDIASEGKTDQNPSSLAVLTGTETSGTEETTDASRSVPPCESPVERHTELADSDGPRLTARSSFSQHCGGSSLLQSEQPGNNSARIAYSGSISIRSDSSATSARSFAFPILQSEWNSSPVKMAKADRRRYRKYRGWRSSLSCCGF